MLEDIAKILENDKRIEKVMDINKKILKLKEQLVGIDEKNDKETYDRLRCELAIKEMNLAYAKKELDKDSLRIMRNIEIFDKYNKLSARIKKIEKKSKKMDNLVETENSEGRKKQISADFVEYYDIFVREKKEISKDFAKAVEFFNNYTYEPKKEVEEPKKKVTTNVVDTKEDNTTLVNNDIKEVKTNKITFISKIKKYAFGAAIGVAAFASIMAFGGSKDSSKAKNVDNKPTIEKEADTKNEIKETVAVADINKQIDDVLEKEDIIEEVSVAEETTEETQELTIGDNLVVSDTSKIMRNQYDATYYENALNPYFDSTESRTIQGVVYKLSDGTIKTARSEDEINSLKNIDGSEVTAYLTYSEYGVEGFYNISDVASQDSARTLVRK